MNKQLMLFLAFCLCNASLYPAIVVNDQDIRDILKPGEGLSYNNENNDGMVFAFDGKKLSIKSMNLNPSGIKNHFAFLMQNRSQMSNLNMGRVLNLTSSESSSHQYAYMTGKEEIVIQAGKELKIHDSILESPNVFLISNQIDLHCFLKDCTYLQIETTSENSPFHIIRFTIPKNARLPIAVHGIINFETGEVTDDLIVIGASEITIKFNESAFK